MWYTNIIVIKDAIILKKAKKKTKLSKNHLNTTVLAKVSQKLSLIDVAQIYKQVMNNANIDIIKKLRLTKVKKYQKLTSQVEIKFN